MTWKGCKRMAPVAVLAVPLTLLPGCGVELAVIGAAASAASQGAAVYSRGKLTASWMGPFDLVVAAAEIALGDLGYVILESSGTASEGAWTVVGIDEDGDKVTVTVDRKTQQLTEFNIDVTWFGQEATARLILKRMAVAIDLEAYQDGTGSIAPAPAYVPPAPDAEPESEADNEESETAKEHTPDDPAAESNAPGKAS